jgi:hypothetical protein
VNNTVRTFEEAFTRLNRFTKCTPLVKLEKETGEPHARALSPRGAVGVGVGVTSRVKSRRAVGVVRNGTDGRSDFCR